MAAATALLMTVRHSRKRARSIVRWARTANHDARRTPDPALGVPLQAVGELAWPHDPAEQASTARSFRENFMLPRNPQQEHAWHMARPCILRGFARDWDFVRSGRFDPETEKLWREGLQGEMCPSEFQPGRSHLKYEEVETMDPSLRMVNPQMLIFEFPDFLDACHLKRRRLGTKDPRISAALRDPLRGAIAANVAYENLGWEDDQRCLPMMPRRVEVDIAAAADPFSVYCAQHDVSHWPPELLSSIAPRDPAEALVPEWAGKGPTANVWMCGGGPELEPLSCNFHCDYSENFHVILSGRKEIFMCHPTDIALLGGTSFCPQAAWNICDSRAGAPPMVYMEEVVREDLRTPMCVASIDADFEHNCRLCPGLRHAAAAHRGRPGPGPGSDGAAVGDLTCGIRVDEDGRVTVDSELDPSTRTWHESGPLWTEARAGDLVYIPPGWLHAVRTWHPSEEEQGLPFALSVNFWHECREEVWEKEKMFRLLEVSSRREALVGDPEQMMADFIASLEVATPTGEPLEEPAMQASSAAANE